MKGIMLLILAGAVLAQECQVMIFADDVQDLINQVPAIDEQLDACPQAIPEPADMFVKDGNTFVDIQMESGMESFTITAQDDLVNSVEAGQQGACIQKIAVNESDLNFALQSEDLGQAVTYLYGQGRATVSGCTVMQKIKYFFANPIAKFIARRIAPKPSHTPGQNNISRSQAQL